MVIVVILAALLGMCSGNSEEEQAADAAANAEEKSKGFHCLSSWDGSNRSLVNQVKDQLRDPGSFEPAETKIAPVADGKHALIMTYRARNGFGGMNVGTAIAEIDHNSCEATLISTDS